MTSAPKRFSSHFSMKVEETAFGHARLGYLETPHGLIETPNFIFCATKASIKGIASHLLKDLGTQVILSNTYHLMLQPGSDLIEKMGGLHRFMNSDLPMLTDSGGYQIFAMGHGSVSEEIKGKRKSKKKSLLKISEEGAKFKSYVDGSTFELTPEKSIQIQKKLGADLIVQLDECTPFHVDKRYTEKSMEMSLRWGKRSIEEFDRITDGKQAVYGVVQGGVYEDLRKRSVEAVLDQGFFGVAIGGSLGKTSSQMKETVQTACQFLRASRSFVQPIHLLGIGGLKDVFFGVEEGVDTFDCVMPTRIARHGWAIVPHSVDPSLRLNILNSAYKDDATNLDPTSACPHSSRYSRSYLHHLFKTKEMLGMQILSLHNIHQMNRLMKDIRQGLSQKRFNEAKRFWIGES